MAGQTFHRRKVLALCAGSTLTLGMSIAGCGLERMLRSGRTFGASLCAWDGAANGNTELWRAAVRDMYEIGLRHVSLISYAYVDPETGNVQTESQKGLDPGPARAALAAAADEAQQLGMQYSIRPWFEIDDRNGPGYEWRGDLELTEQQREVFTESYREYVLDLAELARDSKARCLYIGSELKGLTTDESARDDWLSLIRHCRDVLEGSSCLLSYAANFDEFEQVPFWSALDEIGVDAYFPLSTEREARGPGRPALAVLDKRCRGIFKRLKSFSRRNKRPVYICEWGLVPFDGTTADPSNELPSLYVDPYEAAAGYEVFLDNVAKQGSWLDGVDFWHWQVDPHEDSNYRIRPGSLISKVIRSHLKGDRAQHSGRRQHRS